MSYLEMEIQSSGASGPQQSRSRKSSWSSARCHPNPLTPQAVINSHVSHSNERTRGVLTPAAPASSPAGAAGLQHRLQSQGNHFQGRGGGTVLYLGTGFLQVTALPTAELIHILTLWTLALSQWVCNRASCLKIHLHIRKNNTSEPQLENQGLNQPKVKEEMA